MLKILGLIWTFDCILHDMEHEDGVALFGTRHFEVVKASLHGYGDSPGPEYMAINVITVRCNDIIA